MPVGALFSYARALRLLPRRGRRAPRPALPPRAGEFLSMMAVYSSPSLRPSGVLIPTRSLCAVFRFCFRVKFVVPRVVSGEWRCALLLMVRRHGPAPTRLLSDREQVLMNELIWVSARPGTKRKLLQFTSNRDRQGRIYSLV